MNKHLNYFLSLFAFAAILFLASCGEDGEIPLPGDNSITLTSSSIENDTLRGAPGETVYVKANLGIGSTGDIVVTSNGNAISVPAPNTIASGDSIGIVISNTAQAGATAELTFKSGTITEQLTVKVEAPLVDLTAYDAFLLYAPTGDAISQTFYSTSEGKTYSYNDVVNTSATVSPKIDFGYFYGATLQASLMSPDDYTTSANYDLTKWSTRNATEFRSTTVTASEFDALTVSQGNDVEAFFETGTALTNPKRATGLLAGNVLAFKTSDNRYGLIKVVEVVGTTGANDGIRLAIKVTNAMGA